jgi:predicted transcriptional regulator
MAGGKDSSFSTFFDTYERLSKKPSQQDVSAGIVRMLNERESMPLSDLVKVFSNNVDDLDIALAKLTKLDAIEVTGTGLSQKVTITPRGRDLLDLFKE